MADIHTTDEQLQLFTAEDPYFFTTDNRPLRRLQDNIVAINDQLEDVVTSDFEPVLFVAETPSVETSSGGVYKVQSAGSIEKIILSHGTMGSGGQTVVNPKVNGSNILVSGNRPTLLSSDPDKVDETPKAEIASPNVVPGDLITIDYDEVQTGTPRWSRVEIFILKDQANYEA